jgi:hypothetical protein
VFLKKRLEVVENKRKWWAKRCKERKKRLEVVENKRRRCAKE